MSVSLNRAFREGVRHVCMSIPGALAEDLEEGVRDPSVVGVSGSSGSPSTVSSAYFERAHRNRPAVLDEADQRAANVPLRP